MSTTPQKQLTLEEWATHRFGRTYHPKTLLRWRRNGNIMPAPKKVGREYLVSPNALYIDYNDPNYPAVIAEALSEPTETKRG